MKVKVGWNAASSPGAVKPGVLDINDRIPGAYFNSVPISVVFGKILFVSIIHQSYHDTQRAHRGFINAPR